MDARVVDQTAIASNVSRGASRRLLRSHSSVIALVALILIALSALLAPLLTRFPPNELHVTDRFLSPNATYWFGTDELGRDLFSRVLYGGRAALAISLGAAIIATVFGLAWGGLAAISHRWTDEILMRLADATMAVPLVLAALIFVAAFGPTVPALLVIIGILQAPWSARVIRASVLSEIQQDYYQAAIASGARRHTILVSELIPNVMPTLLVQFAINMASAVLLEAALSFFGLGVQPPLASWGTLLLEGYRHIFLAPTYAVVPGLMIFLAIWALNTLSDGLQEALEPHGHD